MKPSKKEIECIDYSKTIRNNVIRRRLSRIPLILTPKTYIHHFFKNYPTNWRTIPIWIKPFSLLIILIIYFILLPINFFIRLIQIITGDRKYNQKLEELRETYEVDYETSPIKTFEQLYSDKGLRNWGMDYWHLKDFTKEEQMDCIKEWFQILYKTKKEELEPIILKIREENKKIINDYYKENPNGHISPIGIEQALPKEIDRIFGNYE